MAVLAVVVDARPYVLADRRASSVILPSICFTFAIALAWGVVPALAVQVVAVTVAGVRMRLAARRTFHLAVQHAVAIGRPPRWPGSCSLADRARPGWDDALLTVAAAVAWILARYGLAAAVGRISRTGGDGGPAAGDRGAGHRGAAAARAGRAGHRAGGAGLRAAGAARPARRAPDGALGRRVERAARVDALTGLPNRRALQASVGDQHARRRALLLLDLDRFRTVNDALGHRVGDRLLVEVAQRLAGVVPAHDLVVRLGGDEFAVLANRVESVPEARRIAFHLVEALNRPFALDGLPVDVSASIGIALQGDSAGDCATLLREAEAAMYDAKAAGRSGRRLRPGRRAPLARPAGAARRPAARAA
jgi:diguanylate cyclase (GGDEF)-like protein